MDRIQGESAIRFVVFPRSVAICGLLCLGVAACAGVWAYSYQKNLVKARALDNLENQAFAKGQTLKAWYLQKAAETQDAWKLDELACLPKTTGASKALGTLESKALLDVLEKYAAPRRFEAWGILTAKGEWLCWESSGSIEKAPEPPDLRQWPATSPPVLSAFHETGAGGVGLTFYAPLGGLSGGPDRADAAGVAPAYWIAMTISVTKYVFPFMLNATGGFKSQRAYLVQAHEGRILYVNPVPPSPKASHLSYSERQTPDGPASQAARGDIFQGEDTDLSGARVFFATTYVPVAQWGLLTQADRSEVYASLKSVFWLAWCLALIVLLLGATFAWSWWKQQHGMMKEALATATLRYRTLVESAQEGIWVLDAQGLTAFVNSRLCEMLGHRKGDLMGQTPAAYLDPASGEQADGLLQALKEGQSLACEVPLETGRGVLWSRLSSVAIRSSQGALAGTLILVTDITDRVLQQEEREDLVRRLSENQAALERLLDQLGEAREEERQLAARDVHDEIIPWLVGAEMVLTGAEGKTPGLRMGAAATALRRIRDYLSSAQKGCREIIHHLRPEDLGRMGFPDALRLYAERNIMVPVTWDVQWVEMRFAAGIEETAYAIGREALLNAARHAECTGIAVAIALVHDRLSVQICDDGRGFEAPLSRKPSHYGLEVMRERARMVGGSLEVDTADGAGTIIRFEVGLGGRPDAVQSAGL